MTSPIESLVKVAATPSQAKIYVAMLQAAGIPARVDGDNLVDEFAAARRLVNLMGTKVFVPTQSLDAAREVLQPAEIDPAELERQALAAPDGERFTAPPRTPVSMVRMLLTPVLVAIGWITWVLVG